MKRFNFEVFPHEAYMDECTDGEYVKYDDMLVFIANNAEAAPTLELRALRELVMQRDNRINELEAELKKAKERGSVYISKDLLNLNSNAGRVRVRIGTIDQPNTVNMCAAKLAAEILDDTNKNSANADWSALSNGATKADEVLRADIEALKECVEGYDDEHRAKWLDQNKLNKHQNQRINAIDDGITGAFGNGKGKNAVAKEIEVAITRGFEQLVTEALKPGGILNRRK